MNAGAHGGVHDKEMLMYQETYHIPFMLRMPGQDAQRVTQPICNLDIAPTMLDFAGLPIPGDMDGESLVPFLTGTGTGGREHFLLEFWRYFPESTPSYTGVRTDRYKYVEFERGRDPWLFDLQNDPREEINLYGTAEGEQLLPALKSLMAASQ